MSGEVSGVHPDAGNLSFPEKSMALSGLNPDTITTYVRACYGRLPIERVEVQHSEQNADYRVHFWIGKSHFMTTIMRRDVERTRDDGKKFAEIALAPFGELRRIIEEAREAGYKKGKEEGRKEAFADLRLVGDAMRGVLK